MKMLLLMILVVRFFLILTFFFSCTNKKLTPYEIQGRTQGTFYSVKYYSNLNLINKHSIDSVLFDIDLSLSTYNDSSNITKVNNNSTMYIDNLLSDVISRSIEICNETEGAFDITVAPLVNSYGFGPKSTNFNTEYANFFGCDVISISDGLINKKNNIIQLDINGIAQGYSVDILSNYLKQNNIDNFIINIGGEVYCSGNKNKKPWLVAIEKPYQNIQLQKYILKLSNKALATSGSYRKLKKIDGKVISHTMNPKTLKPAENNLLSVSILANNCMDADAYATACMSMGLNKSKQFVSKNNIDACFIYVEKDDTLTFVTNGMLKLISPESPDYSDLQPSLGAAPQ